MMMPCYVTTRIVDDRVAGVHSSPRHTFDSLAGRTGSGPAVTVCHCVIACDRYNIQYYG